MKKLIGILLRYRSLVALGVVAWIAGGAFIFLRLDIEAYPDPAPPLVEVITQNPAWSAEEMERQVTVPLETQLFGLRDLDTVRSISIFGLSDIKLYFNYGSDFFRARQRVLGRLQLVSLPNGLSPQISPWSPTGEIYRYELTGGGYPLNELTATQNWVVRREIKQVAGIIDVTTFGGTTRQYQAEVDPNKLLQLGVTLPQVINAISASNANVGGNYLTQGSQSVNIRGIGLLESLADMRAIVVAERSGIPVFLKDVAEVREGFQPRLGQVGVDREDDAVEGIVLLNRYEHSLPALRSLRAKIAELNGGILSRGMHLRTLYDRTDLIRLTTKTVRHLVILGIVLVTILLLAFLGDVPVSLVAALTIPCSLLFAFSAMVLTNRSANLISIGAIDFGILVDAAVIVLENVFRRLRTRLPDTSPLEEIAEATAEATRPVLFSVLVIIVALIPLFTMKGVPGQIFAPMSQTYVFALTGALIFSLFFAPVLCSWREERAPRGKSQTWLVRRLGHAYGRALDWSLAHRKEVLLAGGAVLLGTLLLLPYLGGEFMPKLEEGNLWVRATLPQDISFEAASQMASKLRGIILEFPEVTEVVSQTGRPDDGTDVTTFNNLEFMVNLKRESEWPGGISKPKLIEQMQQRFERFPGVAFNFSQNIEDNVEEAMSGVKGENSLKLFGDDINVLVAKAEEIRGLMQQVPGITDLAAFPVTGQPELWVGVDRQASARYGLSASDVNAAVTAAIGGQAITQILEGDRRFDFVVRYAPQFRKNAETIGNILLPTPAGGSVPLAQVARVGMREGAFMVYRENGRRYVPIKFSVRGRDLASTMAEVEQRLAKEVALPEGYLYKWAGEYNSLKNEERRLAVAIPITLLIILALLFAAFNSWGEAFLALVVLPFGATGGALSLFVTGTRFSISAAVGFASVVGVCTLGSVVILSGIKRARDKGGWGTEAVRRGALAGMRPVLMACVAAGLGLLPAAVSTGIGVQAQRPLARVVVGGMVTSPLAILFLVPVLAQFLPSLTAGDAKREET